MSSRDESDERDEQVGTSNEEEKNKGYSYTERKVSFQDSRISRKTLAMSLRDSARRFSFYYETQNRLLTKNFAGAEDKDEMGEDNEEPFMENPEKRALSMNMNLSKYQYLNQKGELGFWPTLFTFIKMNLVAGFLFLPAGFKIGGWLFSVVAIFLVSALTVYCNISISECTDAANSYSLSRIGLKAIGKCGYYMVEFGIAISQICFPCSYANLITQILNNMINLWFGTEENYYLYIALALGVLLIPMCLIRNITKFSSMHFLGDLAILATVVSLAYESISQITEGGGFDIDGLKLINSGWAKLLGMSITSLEGIGVILPIKESMKDKKKFNSVIIIGTFVISLVLSGFPLIMYFCYQDTVNEIVLNNLPLEKVYIQIVLLMLMFSILIVYPVTLFPAFQILENIFCKRKNKDKSEDKIKKDHLKTLLENILRISIVTITIVVGVLSINRFDTLLSLAGCGICTPVALIFPSVFHYNLYKKTQSTFRSIVDISIAILGCSLSITVLIFTLMG